MPVYMHRFVNHDGTTYIMGPDQPAKTTVAFTLSPINPATGLFSDARNLAIPYSRGEMGPPELFYCPAPMRDERHMLGSYPKPWGSGLMHGTAWIRTGYMWNPWVKILSGTGSYDYVLTFEDDLLLSRHAPEHFLTGDLCYGMSTTSHFEGDGASWNFAYPDGSVRTMRSPKLYSYFPAGGHADTDWVTYNQVVRPVVEAFGASQ